MGKAVFKLVCAIVFLLSLPPLFLMLASATPDGVVINPTIVTIEPIADSYVNSTDPDMNYGENIRLYVGTKGISYLMFRLPDLPLNVSIGEAKLELYASSGSASGYVDVHHCSDDSWTENGITWNNKPSYDPERTYRVSPRFWTGWENPWYVTGDVQRCYKEGDMKLTVVITSSGAWAYYRSRESGTKPRLVISYLTPPSYTVQVESTDETGRISNVGSIIISGQDCSLPNEVLVKPGSYSLEYNGNYEFVRWETEGAISVASPATEMTTVEIQGAGLIRAVGRSAELILESAQDTGATSNIGYIVIGDEPYAEHHVLPQGIPLIKPGTYHVSYEGGYKFLRWETAGNITVSNPTQPTTTITISAGSSTLRAVGSAEIMEYAYDDGQAESSNYKSEDVGEMWAVRFTPLFSGNLLNARFYIIKDPSIFKIHIMDENRNHIIAPFMRTPPTDGWFDVDLSTFDIQVKARNDFYIGIEWVQERKPSIGYDDDLPRDKRSWHWNGTSWDKYPGSYDIMIRALIETIMLPSQVTCSLDPISIAYMEETEISGSISPSDLETADALITLQYSSDGVSWFNITTVSCISSRYSYSWSPRLPVGNYLIRSAWQGSQTYFGSKSESQELAITKTYPTLTCSFDVEKAETDKDVTISGQISPVIRNAKIILMFTNPDGYQSNRTAWTSSDGRFDYTIAPYKEGTWKVKAYWAGDKNCHSAESSISELDVAPPFPYEIISLAILVVMLGLVIFLILRRKRKRSIPQSYAPSLETSNKTRSLAKKGTSEIVQELLALKSKISLLPQKYSTGDLVFGAGAGKAQEQIPTICAVIDDAVKALEKGLDIHNRPITKSQIADGLKRLVDATRRPAFVGLISAVLSSEGISELEKYINELERVTRRIK